MRTHATSYAKLASVVALSRGDVLGTSAVAAGLPFFTTTGSARADATARTAGGVSRGSFSLDRNRLLFHSPLITERFDVVMLADTHLAIDDEREDPFRKYSDRMTGAYRQTRNVMTGNATNPRESFQQTLARAVQDKPALVALVGDILSYPSEAGVEWVSQHIEQAGLPYIYTAGNHDWHYEGMPGSSQQLREAWINRRLSSLYQGADPMMSSRELHGVRFVAIDNSTYEILPEQLRFLQAELATGKPIVLLIHIPLYAPGRTVSYGCGHPDWGASTDPSYRVERRPQWPETGHSKTTFDFHHEVFAADNVLGVLAGHVHRQSLSVINGVPQVTAEMNAAGGWLDLQFAPRPDLHAQSLRMTCTAFPRVEGTGQCDAPRRHPSSTLKANLWKGPLHMPQMQWQRGRLVKALQGDSACWTKRWGVAVPPDLDYHDRLYCRGASSE